ncbi:MAG: polyhydroxyalkanoic acid system family protein [Deltaproteobacteria bacterium]|nr:polyhydroxyalkanoic acid system family protein [Deltaproteobacteria bacterium]
MSTIKISENHQLGVEAAKRALSTFEEDLKKFGMRLVWSGHAGELKGTGASGDVRVSDHDVQVTIKLGLLAKAAGIDANRLKQSIEKRLRAALG